MHFHPVFSNNYLIKSETLCPVWKGTIVVLLESWWSQKKVSLVFWDEVNCCVAGQHKGALWEEPGLCGGHISAVCLLHIPSHWLQLGAQGWAAQLFGSWSEPTWTPPAAADAWDWRLCWVLPSVCCGDSGEGHKPTLLNQTLEIRG